MSRKCNRPLFQMHRQMIAMLVVLSSSVSCHTPPKRLTPAWKVMAAIRVATTKRALWVSALFFSLSSFLNLHCTENNDTSP
ncbi:Uncharacterized protein TCM_005762 [Theobroma cacao]|uniref:Uncharacterized protein n=1 Tax=Theobroma cacao TaxID=3641 RepID=A0A061DWT0_THECC|nr:Uncharacterized protein TCM_005762 [Theobroma cacao]